MGGMMSQLQLLITLGKMKKILQRNDLIWLNKNELVRDKYATLRIETELKKDLIGTTTNVLGQVWTDRDDIGVDKLLSNKVFERITLTENRFQEHFGNEFKF